MSSIRSLSPPAPVTSWAPASSFVAAILVGHGSTVSDQADETLSTIAVGLKGAGIGLDIRAAALSLPTSVAEAFSGIGRGPVLVVPIFMCDGYTVRTMLPRQLRDLGLALEDVFLTRPVGMTREFSRILAARAEEAVAATSLTYRQHVLVGHGTPRNPASRLAVEGHAAWLADNGPIADVRTAFLDEPPDLASVLDGCDGPALIDGIFFAGGLHAGEDVVEAMALAERPADRYLGPAGIDRRLGVVVEDLIGKARRGADVYCMDEV